MEHKLRFPFENSVLKGYKVPDIPCDGNNFVLKRTNLEKAWPGRRGETIPDDLGSELCKPETEP
jgi:hypothetical protein